MKQVLEDAVRRLAAAQARLDTRHGGPAAGDLYAVDGESGAMEGVFWLVLRNHPDHPDHLFAVPVDGHPLIGVPDVALDGAEVARCGEGAWVTLRFLGVHGRRVGVVTPEALLLARRGVADLANGLTVAPSPEQLRAENDVEYQAWMARVRRSRTRLEEVADEMC